MVFYSPKQIHPALSHFFKLKKVTADSNAFGQFMKGSCNFCTKICRWRTQKVSEGDKNFLTIV